MRSFLLNRVGGSGTRPEPGHAAGLVQDLELDTMLDAMAQGDDFVRQVARSELLSGMSAPEDIRYRQDVLRDCLARPQAVTALYEVAAAAVTAEKQVRRDMFSSPGYVLHRAAEALQLYLGALRKLREAAGLHAGQLRSAGFASLFAMLREELDDAYLAAAEDHFRQLRFRGGTLLSARLGPAGHGQDYVLRLPWHDGPVLLSRLRGRARPGFVLTVADRDLAGRRTLSGLRDRGIDHVASALAQSADQVLGFLAALRRDLGFCLGCLNLRDALARSGAQVCFPVPAAAGKPVLTAGGLYDACLTLRTGRPATGSDISADGKSLVVITGANQGGKSTFLRSVGVAQLMMQSGMFVAARSFSADIRDGVFAHCKRAEDASMTSGMLDEELARMSSIIDHLRPGGLLLCNESFASTNEREGSRIAGDIVRALTDAGVKVFLVTHFFELADGFCQEELPGTLSLRAGRAPAGHRSYRLDEGRPLPTSHARDVYASVFACPQGAG
jgi:hypothetical protein